MGWGRFGQETSINRFLTQTITSTTSKKGIFREFFKKGIHLLPHIAKGMSETLAHVAI